MPISHLLAQGPRNLGPIKGIGPLSTNAQAHYTNAAVQFTGFLSNLIALLSIVGAIWFVYQIILASLAWIGSSGDKQKIDIAQKRFINAVIGLLLIIIAYTLVGVIGRFVGINIYDVEQQIYVLNP